MTFKRTLSKWKCTGRQPTVHNARTLCERNPCVDIEFRLHLPAARVCAQREVAVDDLVILRRDEETLEVIVRAEPSAGLYEGQIVRLGSASAAYSDMYIGDRIIFQARHVFSCTVCAPSSARPPTS